MVMKHLGQIRFADALPGIAALVFLLGNIVHADSASEKWTVPASAMAKKNPIGQKQDSIAAGQKIYQKRCASCHGKTGDGDGHDAVDLGINPAKLSNPRVRSESDGALFWRITTGKKPMPGYGTRLSETDRWNLVDYIRTLAKE
jgi:mono/diheme cytochrome c family protein